MQVSRRKVLSYASSAVVAGSLGTIKAGRAQDISFPTGTVRMVVPFSPGGTADVLARAITERLATQYGTAVVVENRPGAGGNVGAEVVSKATPDGHTLVLGTIGIHAAYTMYRKLNYDPAKDLQPVIVLGEVPCVIAVHPSRPFTSFDQFLAYARSHPDTLTFGSAGVGSSTHMVGELFQQAAGVKLRHVPYRGSSMAMNDLLGGQIDMMFELITTAASIVESGAIRGLAVTSRQRSPSLPQVSTIDELGIPGFEGTGWFTIATAAGVPPATVERLNRDIEQILHRADLQGMWKSLALTVLGGSPASAAAFFVSEREKWAKVIRAANIRLD